MTHKISLPPTLAIRGVVLGFAGLILAGRIADVLADTLPWPSLLAPVCYVAGLWFASGILVRLDSGDTFSDAVISGLSKVGASLMLGAFLAVLVEPALVQLQGNGFTEMRGVAFNLELSNLMLAVTGLVLVLIAKRGADLRAQLESFV